MLLNTFAQNYKSPILKSKAIYILKFYLFVFTKNLFFQKVIKNVTSNIILKTVFQIVQTQKSFLEHQFHKNYIHSSI